MSKEDDQVMPQSYQEWVLAQIERELKPVKSTQRTLLHLVEWVISANKDLKSKFDLLNAMKKKGVLKKKDCNKDCTSEFLPLDTE